MDNLKNHNIKLIIVITIITTFLISSTYAFLEFTKTENIVGTKTGCFDVNYSAQVINATNLVSTTNYTQGATSQVTLSKDEGCQIYNEASIYIHTNTTETTAPINTVKALKYKVLNPSNTIISEGTITTTNGEDLQIATVPLTTTATTYTIYIWIDSSISLGYYNSTAYSGYIYASSIQTSMIGASQLNSYATNIMVPVATSDASIDFSQTSEASGTNGIYLRSGTENNMYPIYYYRGDVDNNLIFADTCWKVVRTTETGGLKLLYNGTPTNGQCNNTGSASQIGTKAFNSSYNSPTYVGYMYSSPYTFSSKSMSGVTDTYYYGNDVTYSNGTYTLTDTISSNSWSSIYLLGLKNNHYTCFSTSTTCTEVYYIHHANSSDASYITLTGGKNVEDALADMLGADDENTENYNTTSSTIKGNNTTEGTLDYWYYTNIEQKGYSSYIEDTVWCNDRSIFQADGWNPDGGRTSSAYIFFSSDNRWNTASPSLSCARNIDSFTKDDIVNGNGNLDYPVGLLTADEIMLGGGANSENYSYYLYNEDYFWTGSPSDFWSTRKEGNGFVVCDDGTLTAGFLDDTFGVRPSVSLKPGFSLTGNGDGTATNPYVVQTS